MHPLEVDLHVEEPIQAYAFKTNQLATDLVLEFLSPAILLRCSSPGTWLVPKVAKRDVRSVAGSPTAKSEFVLDLFIELYSVFLAVTAGLTRPAINRFQTGTSTLLPQTESLSNWNATDQGPTSGEDSGRAVNLEPA